MIKIEIESSQLREIKGVSAKTSKPYNLRIQNGYAFIVGPDGTPAKYPEKFEFMLDGDQVAFPPGIYELHPSAISVRDGKLFLTPNLAPVKTKG